jgi:integrase
MIVKRGKHSYQVRVAPYSAKTLRTLEAARVYERDLWLRKGLGDLYTEPPATLAAELDGFQQRKHGLSPRTAEFHARCAVFWRDRFGDRTLLSLKRAEVEDAITLRAAEHPRSAANELQHLKAVLTQAEQRGQRFDRAILAIPAVRYDERDGVALTWEQVQELASFAPEYVRRVIVFAATSGMRFGELFSLTDDRVDLEGGAVRVPRGLNKSRRLKVVDLCAGEVQVLREQMLARPIRGGEARVDAGRQLSSSGTLPERVGRGQAIGNEQGAAWVASRPADRASLVFPKANGRPWNRHHFRDRIWLPAALAAGLGEIVDGHYTGVRPHDLRHTATTFMCLAGMRPEQVAERRGDRDGGLMVFRRYRHLVAGEMRNAVTALDTLLTGDVREEAREA